MMLVRRRGRRLTVIGPDHRESSGAGRRPCGARSSIPKRRHSSPMPKGSPTKPVFAPPTDQRSRARSSRNGCVRGACAASGFFASPQAPASARRLPAPAGGGSSSCWRLRTRANTGCGSAPGGCLGGLPCRAASMRRGSRPGRSRSSRWCRCSSWRSGSRAGWRSQWAPCSSNGFSTGAFGLEPEEIRREGAGHLLGRVIEAEAVESLALGGGFMALLAALELVIAAGVLAIASPLLATCSSCGLESPPRSRGFSSVAAWTGCDSASA